jgi:hypothetical protein
MNLKSSNNKEGKELEERCGDGRTSRPLTSLSAFYSSFPVRLFEHRDWEKTVTGTTRTEMRSQRGL